MLSFSEGARLLLSLVWATSLATLASLTVEGCFESRQVIREWVVRWGRVMRKSRVGRRWLEPGARSLERSLTLAGGPLRLSVEEFVVASLVTGVALSLLSFFLLPDAFPGRLATAAVAFVVGLMAPRLRLQALYESRAREVRRSIPEVEGLISLCLTAGMDFTAALRTVTLFDDRLLAEELGAVLASLELGVTRRAALELLAERLPIQEVETFFCAVTHAEAKGVSIAEALRQEALLGRQRLSVRAEELATRAGVLFLLPLMLLLVSILLLLIGPLMISGLGF